MNDYVFILDVDGVVTDSKMYYSPDGKLFKVFGSDDWDLLKQLSIFVTVQFITADKKGFEISKKRIKDDMNMNLELVSNLPKERWEWMKNKFHNKKIIFMGDGWGDFLSLKNSDIGITVVDALDHVKKSADLCIERRGSERAVAEACIFIFKTVLNIDIIDL